MKNNSKIKSTTEVLLLCWYLPHEINEKNPQNPYNLAKREWESDIRKKIEEIKRGEKKGYNITYNPNRLSIVCMTLTLPTVLHVDGLFFRIDASIFFQEYRNRSPDIIFVWPNSNIIHSNQKQTRPWRRIQNYPKPKLGSWPWRQGSETGNSMSIVPVMETYG